MIRDFTEKSKSVLLQYIREGEEIYHCGRWPQTDSSISDVVASVRPAWSHFDQTLERIREKNQRTCQEIEQVWDRVYEADRVYGCRLSALTELAEQYIQKMNAIVYMLGDGNKDHVSFAIKLLEPMIFRFKEIDDHILQQRKRYLQRTFLDVDKNGLRLIRWDAVNLVLKKPETRSLGFQFMSAALLAGHGRMVYDIVAPFISGGMFDKFNYEFEPAAGFWKHYKSEYEAGKVTVSRRSYIWGEEGENYLWGAFNLKNKGTYGFSLLKSKSDFYDWDKNAFKNLKIKRPEFDRNGSKWMKDYVMDKDGQLSFPEMTKWNKELMTLGEFGAEAEANVSLAESSLSGENDFVKGSIGGKVLSAEAHSSVKAGFYVYDDQGNKFISPSVRAEVGASASLLEVNTEGRLGLGKDKNMFGVYGKGSASVGKVEAKMGASVGLFDDNGLFNPEARVSGKLEAVALEAKGSLGVSVGGTDIGISGSVNVGIGAHADIGIKDGKLKVDIGASLGIGASIGFELDVSGTVKAVQDASASIFNGLKNGIKSLFGS